jgi:hypothetical protein
METIKTGDISISNFRVGMCVQLRYITPDAGEVMLSLKDSHDNVILHFNPQWQHRRLLLNTCKGGTWGTPEEVKGTGFNFASGIPMTVRLEAFNDYIRVIVNGLILYEFKPRSELKIANISKASFHCVGTEKGIKEPRLLYLSACY